MRVENFVILPLFLEKRIGNMWQDPACPVRKPNPYDGFAIMQRALNGETPSVPGIGALGGLRYLPFIKRCRDVACNVSTVVCLRN